jgi:hypothetical protein
MHQHKRTAKEKGWLMRGGLFDNQLHNWKHTKPGEQLRKLETGLVQSTHTGRDLLLELADKEDRNATSTTQEQSMFKTQRKTKHEHTLAWAAAEALRTHPPTTRLLKDYQLSQRIDGEKYLRRCVGTPERPHSPQ